MQRVFDVLLASFGLLLLSPLLASITVLGLLDTGSPFFRQERVGRFQRPFILVKFRTMSPHAASVPTHMADPAAFTRYGGLLRRSKLDELPQLWNVLKGDMSLVGPRPCLPTQVELVHARSALGVFGVRPGVTGLAQIHGIDMSTPELLAQTDAEMLRSLTIATYCRLLMLTLSGRGLGDRIVHRGQV